MCEAVSWQPEVRAGAACLDQLVSTSSVSWSREMEVFGLACPGSHSCCLPLGKDSKSEGKMGSKGGQHCMCGLTIRGQLIGFHSMTFLTLPVNTADFARSEGRQTPSEPPVPYLCNGVLSDSSASCRESGNVPSTCCALAHLILSQP